MKFRKKPVVVEAMQWDGSSKSIHEIADWAGYDETSFAIRLPIVDIYEILTGVISVRIRTLEGNMSTAPGDWIIKGIKGELYPCKPDIFEATYEQVGGGA